MMYLIPGTVKVAQHTNVVGTVPMLVPNGRLGYELGLWLIVAQKGFDDIQAQPKLAE